VQIDVGSNDGSHGQVTVCRLSSALASFGSSDVQIGGLDERIGQPFLCSVFVYSE